MTRINLLPWREWRRERLKKEFFAILGAMAALGAAVVLLAYLVLSQAIGAQQARNAYLTRNIQELDKQVAEIEKLQQEKRRMQERIDVVQNLQANRATVVRLFHTLVHSLPDGVYFTAISLKGDVLSIAGTAEANARISSLMRALDETELFSEPNLQSVKANAAFGESASDFSLVVKLVKPGVEEEVRAVRKAPAPKKSSSKARSAKKK